ncbi:MAG: TVP38/TMEM64 family protein [Candidatus Aminicenantes bacterium]|nr:TVP38/TMEM64 family protein [Candidatus Aminicenantes bacterium]
MNPEPIKKRFPFIHILLIIIVLGLLVFASIKYAPALTRLMSKPEKFKEFLDSYGTVSALIYILLQAAQIVIAVIPGEVVQIAGGYAFGTILGTLYSVTGTVLGTLLVFFATRLLGYSLVRTFVPQKKLDRFDFLMNNPKSEIAIFILFLIPGVPKDALTYVAGLTPIKPLRFLLICTIARFPGLWGSAYIGANLQKKDYLPVWILSAVALVLFVTGLLLKDKIIDKLHRLRHPGK